MGILEGVANFYIGRYLVIVVFNTVILLPIIIFWWIYQSRNDRD